MYIPKCEIEKKVGPDDKVLDIGSWNEVFPRANVIIDVNPYETRKNFYPDEKEHFSKATWLQADVNKADTWAKFKDKEFDFVICSHLLEDVRDPLYVCEQLNRVAKRGYIEVPTRYRECARAKSEDTVSGYDHHRWLVDVIDGSLVFTAKLHWAHTVDYLTERKRDYLNFHNFHYFGCFFEDSFHYYERCPKGELLEGANLLYQFDNLDLARLRELTTLDRGMGDRSRGNIQWVDQFSLPVELETEELTQKYIDKYKKSHIGWRMEECDRKIVAFNQQIAKLDLAIADLNYVEAQNKADIARLKGELQAILESKSWRLTAPLRWIKRLIA